MKLIRKLQITEDEFYDYLENDLLAPYQDINPDVEFKKGAIYTNNQEDPTAQVTLEILDYKRYSHYKALVKSYTDNLIISYQTLSLDNGNIEIIFEQNIQSFKRKNRFFSLFKESIYLGRMSDSLQDLQQKIIQKRNS